MGAVILLNLMGLLALSSIADSTGSDTILHRQEIGSLAGILLMILLSQIDYRRFTGLLWVLYAGTVVLLGLVLMIGTTGGGAQRWISIAGITFQPSEIAKILLILFYAEFIIKYKEKFSQLQMLLLSVLLIAPPVVMVLKEPDLSTSIMLCLIFCVILFIGGISWKIIACILAVLIPGFLILIFLALHNGLTFLSAYQQERILAWLHPEDYANTTAYQTINSMTAIGSGGLIGKGYSAGKASSLLQTGFISEAQTDFIFSVVGEEYGFIGCCAVLFLLTIIAVRCFWIAGRCRRLSGKILSSGVGSWIGLQGYMNIGVATGILPNTGIPFPFVSYGLTSLICLYCSLGFVLNVRIQNEILTTRTSRTEWGNE